VIASVSFRNFKALRNASVRLTPFNLVVGPNGSGKTSLIQALLHLRSLSTMSVNVPGGSPAAGDAEMEFRFFPPNDHLNVRLTCASESTCGGLQISPPDAAQWAELKTQIGRIASFDFDYEAMAQPSLASQGTELAADGSNLAGFLAAMHDTNPDPFKRFTEEIVRLFPEFESVALRELSDGREYLCGTLIGEVADVSGESLSQGLLHTIAIVALSLSMSPPSVICIEEVDRGIHPRMLREIRDALYRLSYPQAYNIARPASQVIVTTHSPYLLDLFRDHPDEVIVTQKHGREAHFERLSERPDLPQLLEEGALGDLWFSGIIGGVPEERS
jgi:predicted ATPase